MDFERQFRAYRGATFGLQPTLRQSNHWRPQAKSMRCEGLYFTGSSTHPGAGVPIVLQNGKICAEELRRDEPEDDFR
jgi:phytoene desaturase